MKITINESVSEHNCETCGYYSDTIVDVAINEKTYRFCTDNHFGDGDFDAYRPARLLAAFLRARYPDAEITGNLDEDG